MPVACEPSRQPVAAVRSGLAFHFPVNDRTELRLLDIAHAESLFQLFKANRDHLRAWHPWVDVLTSAATVEAAIRVWQQQHASHRGFHSGIWFDGQLCGVINHLNVDWTNRWTALSYWLGAAHQGQGIMTACCRTMIDHAFNDWKLNRVTIECASENLRSRAIPERLGFKLEGVIRSIEWLHDHYADHALYGLLSSDQTAARQ
jgi:ribosomal-protein-serine acetyltransferase